jgi:predicted transporter
MKNQFDPNKNQFITPRKRLFAKFLLALFIANAYFILVNATDALAQDGSAGINQATSMVKGYFSAGCNLMYAIGAILAIVGAIKVYRKWNEGEPDTNKVAAAWFGSCIFLVVVATVIQSFFGM